MEIIAYISGSDGFTHYIINNSFGVPFELRLLIMIAGGCFLFLVFKKIIG